MASARPRVQPIVISVISITFKTTRWTSSRSVSTGIAPGQINGSHFEQLIWNPVRYEYSAIIRILSR